MKNPGGKRETKTFMKSNIYPKIAILYILKGGHDPNPSILVCTLNFEGSLSFFFVGIRGFQKLAKINKME